MSRAVRDVINERERQLDQEASREGDRRQRLVTTAANVIAEIEALDAEQQGAGQEGATP